MPSLIRVKYLHSFWVKSPAHPQLLPQVSAELLKVSFIEVSILISI